MEENIKSARQTGILLILLLVFSFNLHSNINDSIQKFNILHGFWLHNALSSSADLKMKVSSEPNQYAKVKKNIESIVNESPSYIRSEFSKFDINDFEINNLVKIYMEWGFWSNSIYTPKTFARGNEQNKWISTIVFSSIKNSNLAMVVRAKGEKIASYKTIPTDSSEFNDFFKILSDNIDNYTVIMADLSWSNEEFSKGEAASFFKVNYDLDTSNLYEATLEQAAKALKGNVKLPLFDITMQIEQAYLSLIVLSTALLLFFNSQLRLVNKGIQDAHFDRFLLTAWKLYSTQRISFEVARYGEGLFGFLSYSLAAITPSFVVYFYSFYYVEIGEVELHWLIIGLMMVLVGSITLLSLINIVQIIRKKPSIDKI